MTLVIGGSSQANIFDRKGRNVYNCVKGDRSQSINLRQTKVLNNPESYSFYLFIILNFPQGHVFMLNDGCWNPHLRNEFITCSVRFASGTSTTNIISTYSILAKRTAYHRGQLHAPSVLTVTGWCSDATMDKFGFAIAEIRSFKDQITRI